MKNNVIIVTGVSGSGKTTIGIALAERLQASFYDDFRNEWIDYQSDMMIHPYTQQLVNTYLPEIKDTVARLTKSDQAYPVTTSCLDYFKYLVSSRTDTSMIQAQRDYFGAHTYQRTDDPSGKAHHTKWH